MTKPATFGGPNAYYAATEEELRKRAAFGTSPFEERLRELLEGHDPELRERAERTFKQWNLIIRDYLRSDTGLRLSVGDELQAVPVRIVAGLPGPLAHLLSKIPTDVLMLYLERAVFHDGQRCLRIASNNFKLLSGWIEASPHKPVGGSPEQLGGAAAFIKQALAVLEDFALEKRIGEIEQDTLGAYFFNVPKIELYWMVIGLVSRILHLPVEALTAVVAIHELAHAYTHLGRDIDRQNWQTASFATTGIRIAEGLAQFYTAVVCDKLEPRFPEARRAYERLLKIQPAPYKVHVDWAGKPADSGEVVRAAMIECRSKRTQKYEEFEAFIDLHLASIKNRKREKPKHPPGAEAATPTAAGANP
jgi:hypothetical protein